MIKDETWKKLEDRMERLGIEEEDLFESFILGSGKGGQKQNRTKSTVQLKHPISGEIIKCGKSRAREDNRYFARVELCDRLEGVKKQRSDQVRKQKKRRSRRRDKSED